jgi:hypothetical protein
MVVAVWLERWLLRMRLLGMRIDVVRRRMLRIHGLTISLFGENKLGTKDGTTFRHSARTAKKRRAVLKMHSQVPGAVGAIPM